MRSYFDPLFFILLAWPFFAFSSSTGELSPCFFLLDPRANYRHLLSFTGALAEGNPLAVPELSSLKTEINRQASVLLNPVEKRAANFFGEQGWIITPLLEGLPLNRLAFELRQRHPIINEVWYVPEMVFKNRLGGWSSVHRTLQLPHQVVLEPQKLDWALEHELVHIDSEERMERGEDVLLFGTISTFMGNATILAHPPEGIRDAPYRKDMTINELGAFQRTIDLLWNNPDALHRQEYLLKFIWRQNGLCRQVISAINGALHRAREEGLKIFEHRYPGFWLAHSYIQWHSSIDIAVPKSFSKDQAVKGAFNKMLRIRQAAREMLRQNRQRLNLLRK
jgi:hypothetical protein